MRFRFLPSAEGRNWGLNPTDRRLPRTHPTQVIKTWFGEVLPMRALLTVEDLATQLHKSVSSVRSDATRNPSALPPFVDCPGTDACYGVLRT